MVDGVRRRRPCPLGWIVWVMLGVTSWSLAEDPVTFVDPRLQAVVEDALWVDDPTPSDMESLVELRCIEQGVTDITGLETAVNLRELSLRLNRIADISPLAACTQLEDVDLSQNTLISDLSPLANMTGLRRLDCHRNRISDLAFAAKLTNLEYLVLRWNELTDISGLSHLTKLTSLHLEYNYIEDIGPLAPLTRLELIDLAGNRIADLTPLAGLTRLTSLRIEENPIEDVSPLSGLTALNTLKLAGARIQDISALTNLTNLRRLWLDRNPLGLQAYQTDLYTLVARNPGLMLAYDPNPQVPQGLRVVGTPRPGAVTLRWDPVENGPSYTSTYQVQRASDGSSLPSPVSSWQPDTTWTDTTAQAGNTYTYWVQCAIGPNGEQAGDTSSPVTVRLGTTPRLTVSADPAGTVTTPGIGTFEYAEPTVVTATAAPRQPSQTLFAGWTGSAVTAGRVADPCASTTTVTVDQELTLHATFIERFHTVTLSSSAGGSVVTPGEGPFAVEHGSPLTVTAQAEANHVFSHWTGSAVDQGRVGNPSSATVTLTVTENTDLHAVFAVDGQAYLDVQAGPGGTVSGGGLFLRGQSVPIAAAADPDYRFSHWTATGAVVLADVSQSSTTVLLNGSGQVTAHFVLADDGPRRLICTAAEGGFVVQPGEGSFSYPYGTEVTVQAQPYPGFVFAGWTGSLTSSLNPLRLVLRHDTTLTARFVSIRKTLHVESGPGGRIVAPVERETRHNAGAVVDLVARSIDPNLFTFVGWQGPAVSAGAVADPNALRTTVTITESTAVRAVFVSRLQTLYVDDDAASDPGPGDPNLSNLSESGSVVFPFDRIQEAIDAAPEHATVIVRPGVYPECLTFQGKALRVTSFDPNGSGAWAYPVIDAGGTGRPVTFDHGEDANSLLSGFVLTGGRDALAAAVLLDHSSPTLTHLVIAGNQRVPAPDADGLKGGVLYAVGCDSLLAHCTIAHNRGGAYGAGLTLIDCNAVLVNSIVWDNHPVAMRLSRTWPDFVSASDLSLPWPGAGNRSVDPLFARPGRWIGEPHDGFRWEPGDYHLRSGRGRWDPVEGLWLQDDQDSPCLGAGDPSWAGLLEAGGEAPNLGAYGGTPMASR